MRNLIAVAMTVCLAGPIHAAETGTIIETFGCTLKDGKTMADFDAAADYFNAQVDAAGALKSYFAGVLAPLRANTPLDLIWVGASPNLNNWASEGEAFAASEAGPRTQARFDSVADCESGLYFSEILHDALAEEPDDGETVIDAYACSLLPGKTLADLAAPTKAYKTAVAALTTAGLGAFRTVQWTPYLANTPYDVIYLSVNDDLGAFARTNTYYLTSPEGKAAEAAWAKVVICESGVWAGRLIRQPAAPPP